MTTIPQFGNIFDLLLEGTQIHDFNWRYIYVNDALVKYSKYSREELIGYTVMEKYPGIEQTDLFKTLQRCMNERVSEQFETEFVFPDGTKAHFELSIQPIPEGIFILSVDRTEQYKAKQKLIKVNRLYAFTSAINQSIVHIDNEQDLLNNACEIAVTIGQFKATWIDLIDEQRGDWKTVSLCDELIDAKESDINYDEVAELHKIIADIVIQTQEYVLNNDVLNDPAMKPWKEDLEHKGVKASISLPIKKHKKIVGVFSFHSTVENFFDIEEIALLEKATTEISFALEIFEKNNKHKETEELVIENEKRFRALIENGEDLISLCNANGNVFYTSPSIYNVLGYTIESFSDILIFDLLHPDELPKILEQVQVILETPGSSFFCRQRYQHKNGNWIWCEGTVTNMLHEPGINGLVLNFRDISERKLAEQQQEFDRNNLNALINNTNDLLWSVDRDFKLITSNIPFDEILTLAFGSPIEKGSNVLSVATKEEIINFYKDCYERAFAGETFTEIQHMEIPFESWMEVSFYPIRKGEEVIGTACHSRNITDRKMAELKLKQQNIELVKTNTELDRFVYSVSHDLRSPLTSILGLLSFIEEESQESDTLEHAKMIRSSINRLDGFIKNILSYSQNNRAELQIEKIPLQETINEVVDLLRNSNEAKGIHFEIDINEKEAFYSDERSLVTILENLVSNAIKFQNKSLSEQHIKISATVDRENLELQIADNGIGIAPAFHNKIFEMFYRLSGSVDGSGIGLYIVKESVEKLQGSIQVYSEEGKGTMFEIKLKNLKE